MSKFHIKPYEGAGPLKFGMSRIEVEQQMGPAKFVDIDHEAGVITEYRLDNCLQLGFDIESNGLVLISFYPPLSGISLGEKSLEWASSAEWHELLFHPGSGAKETVGIQVSFRYGVSASGLKKTDSGAKSLTVFARGQWNEGDPSLRVITQ
jgi:hypothetical protein